MLRKFDKNISWKRLTGRREKKETIVKKGLDPLEEKEKTGTRNERKEMRRKESSQSIQRLGRCQVNYIKKELKRMRRRHSWRKTDEARESGRVIPFEGWPSAISISSASFLIIKPRWTWANTHDLTNPSDVAILMISGSKGTASLCISKAFFHLDLLLRLRVHSSIRGAEPIPTVPRVLLPKH